MNRVFYVPGTRFAYDEVIIKHGREVGKWTGKSLEQAKAEHPELVCIEREECIEQITKLATKPPQEITEDSFIEMRDMLPPCAWTKAGNTESFHFSEFDVFDITGIYVRIGKRHFSMKDCYRLTHQERVDKIRQAFPDA